MVQKWVCSKRRHDSSGVNTDFDPCLRLSFEGLFLCDLVCVFTHKPTITLLQMENFFQQLLTNLSQPEYGLMLLFWISLLAATLLPLGSEPFVLGWVWLNPNWVWPAWGVCTLGNTLGGVIGWWIGYGAKHWSVQHAMATGETPHVRATRWLERLGPMACLGAWLPIIGDPLCVVAGYLRLPFWPCVMYMAIGKALRYAFILWGWQWWMQ